MKKIYFSLIALTALLASSCSSSDSDEVAVTVVNKTYSVGVTVSTSSAYESYGSSLFTNFLGNYSNYYVGVFAYLYDEDGALVASTDSYSQTLNTQSLSFTDIDTGSYTLVCIQMIVNSSNSYQSAAWTIGGTSKLSTLAVTTSYTGLQYYHAVAKNVSSVTVGTSNTNVSVSTKPLGCIIDIGYENFAQSGFTMVGFYLDQYAFGYYFDPSLSGTAQYYYGSSYSSEQYWTSIAKMYDTDGIDDSGEMNGYYFIQSGETTYCFGVSNVYDGATNVAFASVPDDGESFSFEDGNYYKAYCYYTGDSDVCDTYLGEADDTDAFSEWYDAFEKSSSLWMPYLEWNASVADVQSYMSGFTLEYGSDGQAEAFNNSYLLAYVGKSPIDDIYYYFDTATTGLTRSLVWYDNTAITWDELLAFLEENFIDLDWSSYYAYVSSDFSTIIILYDYSDDYNEYCLVYYSYEYLYGSAKNQAKGYGGSVSKDVLEAQAESLRQGLKRVGGK